MARIYGMLMPARTFSAGNGYRYGFNGKEKDNEVKGEGNQQDYGMRIYDPRLGRFLSVDPLTKDYPWFTPFQFASNRPLTSIDLDGGEAKIVIYGQKIISREMDDGYIKTVGEGGAQAMGVTPKGVSSGKDFLSVLRSTSSDSHQNISAVVFYGHSWNRGLFLSSGNGFYRGNANGGGPGSANFNDLRTMSENGQIPFSAHTLFIFAGCGTAGNGYGGHGAGNGEFDPASFAATIGDYIRKNHVLPDKAFTGFYKVTTIGATDLTNEHPDGTSSQDPGKNAHYIKIEKLYKIERTVEEYTETTGWWIFSHTEKKTRFVDKTTVVQTKTTDLGTSINPAEIVNIHNDKDVQIHQ